MAIVGNFFSWMVFGLPAFLFVITIVVFFHELGHFAMARLFGVTIQAFSIGFGREIFGWTDRHGTRWKISWLPLGGYVRFAGDADAASRPDTEYLKKLDAQAREGALHCKPLYQRALVAAAGPLANFILAIAIFTGVYMLTPQPAEPPVIAEITAGSAAEAAGLQLGDVIRHIYKIKAGVYSFEAGCSKPGWREQTIAIQWNSVSLFSRLTRFSSIYAFAVSAGQGPFARPTSARIRGDFHVGHPSQSALPVRAQTLHA
jgi:hypothetical protein